MRRMLALALWLALPLAAATAQSPADKAAGNLSLEQKTKVADAITRDAGPPIPAGHFALAVDNAVPPDVALRPVPGAVEQITTQLKGASYVVVEEQIALVDSKTRKILAVIPRGRSQTTGSAQPR